MAFAAALLLIAGCSTGGTTDTTSGGGLLDPTATETTVGATTGTDVMSQLAALQSDVAQFGSEVEAVAPDSIRNAWTNLELAVNDLSSAAADDAISIDELAPVQAAVEEVTDAVIADGGALSTEFHEFWTNFGSRVTALAS
jgi:hypothetical protein